MRNGLTHENLGTSDLESISNQIKKLKEVFICFDFACNLNCPHCTLQKIRMKRNLSSVRKTIDFILGINPDITFNFFGGEPLLLQDSEIKLFEDLFYSNPIIVSTNLLRLTDYQLKLLKNVEDVNTSWNPRRFSDNELHSWMLNLNKLKERFIPFSIMITLTQDLIDNYKPEEFLDFIEYLEPRNLDLKFMVGDYDMDFSLVDNWLVELYKYYQVNCYSFACLLFKEMEDVIKGNKTWKQYCPTVGTIYPNGNLKLGCPYYEYKTDKSQCLTCEYYPVCQGGCDIQEKCAFPKNLYEVMKNAKVI